MLAVIGTDRYRSRMNLEDHLGDIICKARAMSGVSAATAAAAAGISETELSALEATGQPGQRLDFPALANLIGLNPGKLEAIANGWLPAEKDLSLWRELRQISTTEGGNTVHCYLIWDEVTRDAALFDTGLDAAPALKLIGENQLQLNTFSSRTRTEDHVAGLPADSRTFPKIRSAHGCQGRPAEQRNRPNDFIMLGSLRITNRETPGHAEDGVTYIIGTWPDDAPHVAMVGDAIFAGSIGRGNQSWDLARQKVREQIFTLPAETLICPGHGPLTTVAEEKAHNPFF